MGYLSGSGGGSPAAGAGSKFGDLMAHIHVHFIGGPLDGCSKVVGMSVTHLYIEVGSMSSVTSSYYIIQPTQDFFLGIHSELSVLEGMTRLFDSYRAFVG